MNKKYFLIMLLSSSFLYNGAQAGVYEAQKFLAEKNYVSAVFEAQASLDQDKKNKEAYEVLLKVYLYQKKDNLYLQTYQEYINNIQQYDFEQLKEAAVKALVIKDHNLSNSFLQYARFLRPEEAVILNLMGVNFFYLKKYKQSIAALHFAVKYSSSLYYLVNLARSYAFNGQVDVAISYYKKALAKNPRFNRAKVELQALQSTGSAENIPMVGDQKKITEDQTLRQRPYNPTPQISQSTRRVDKQNQVEREVSELEKPRSRRLKPDIKPQPTIPIAPVEENPDAFVAQPELAPSFNQTTDTVIAENNNLNN